MQIIKLLTVLLILKTTLVVVVGYVDYFPADFQNDFLSGRDAYFYGWYSVAFYTHILSGPLSLVMGLLLMNTTFLKMWPRWHRLTGKLQVLNVVLLVAPSGLYMAAYAMRGPVAVAGFAVLAVATAVCAMMGWRRAVERKFALHRLWMQRCFALLCSAVVLRVIGGASEVLGLTGSYPLAAWISWLLPLLGVEVYHRSRWLQAASRRTFYGS